MSAETETDTDVIPCRACQSPVFHDELFCEACGSRVSGEPEAARPPRQPAVGARGA